MAQEKLKIILEGDSKSVNDAVKSAGAAFDNLGNTIKNIAIGGGALVLAQKGFQMLENGIKDTIAFFKDCTTEAGNAEIQLTKLNTALKSTGNFTQESSDALVKYAESLQGVTAYEDDAIVGVEAMLATFKLSNEEIKVATQATLDLAAATGQDLQSAAILMGKAMVGETGTLKRYGIMVDENKLATQGWKAVIDEINVEFGGQALAQGETYSGMLERMKNNIGNLKETIGGAFLPVLKEMMDKFTAGGGFEKLQEWAGKAAAKIKEFLDALMGADWSSTIDALKNLGTSLASLISGGSSFDMTSGKAQSFADTLAGIVNTVAGFTTAVNLTSQSLMLLYETWELVTLGGPIGVFREGIEQFTNSITGNKDAIIANIEENVNLTGRIEELKTRLNNLIETGNNFNVTTDESTAATVRYSEGLIGAIDTTNIAIPATDGLDTSVKSAATSLEEANAAAYKLKEQLNILSPAEVLAEDKASKLKDTIKKMGEVTMESVGEAIRLKEAIAALESKTITITTMYINREAYYGGKSNTGSHLSGAQQSGGVQLDSRWINDLNIPVVRGEAILPASLTRAIKENRGSFAGLNIGNDGGSVSNYFNISELVVREEADIERIAQQLYSLQQSALRGAGRR